MHYNIPLELRLAPRWCFTGREQDEGMAKAPFMLDEEHKFVPLSVHDYHLCLTFEELEPLLAEHPSRGFGFILVDGDGFTCVDLDVKDTSPVDATRRQNELIAGLDTYTELSQSGCGIHLWLRGEINGAIKTNEMEVYSRERFIICTGATLHDKPMAYDQSVLDFFNTRAVSTIEQFNMVDVEQTKTDEQVLDAALAGDHTGKFACLMSGDWDVYSSIMVKQGAYEFTFDASQADSAFMGIITFYTRNIDQCKRLWRLSALADVAKRYPNDPQEQRRKLGNIGTEYKLNRAIAFAVQRNDKDRLLNERLTREARDSNEHLIAKAEQAAKGVIEVMEGDIPPVGGEMEYPPGMMGELSRYFFSQSIKPIKEFAIAEALAVCAGLFGRSYNISGTGLNMFLMVLAPSGTGKSALSKNPENLMSILERNRGVMGARKFIMSKRFTHENAMFQEFKERSCFCQCLSEFGKVFKNMMSMENQGGALATVRECMTDIYSKSGQFDVAGGMRYATAERSVDLGYPVAYSFLGESVPEPFFDAITPDMFTDGFISRFLFLEYTGPIPYDTLFHGMEPPPHLMAHLEQAVMGVTRSMVDINKVDSIQVGMDAYSGKWFADFSRECTDNANATIERPVANSLWTRANLKVLKLAALVATMDCPSRPCIEKQHVDWAYAFVMRHNDMVQRAVAQGRMANSSDTEAMNAVREICMQFYKTRANLTTYHAKAADMQKNGHVPWGWIQRTGARRACFKPKGYKKSTQLIREALDELKRCGSVRQINPKEVIETYGTQADIYQVVG